MDIERNLRLDYESQHFGFHPRIFMDNIYNAFYESIFEALTQLKHFLKEEFKSVPAESIEENTGKLFQEMVKKLDIVIDRLELYLNANILVISKNIVLPEDEVHITHPCTVEEDKNLDKELEELEQRIIKERVRKYILKTQVARQKFVKQELEMFENKLQQLLTVVTQSNVTHENLKTTMEKCLALQNKIKSSTLVL